jgi:hypothetical protein
MAKKRRSKKQAASFKKMLAGLRRWKSGRKSAAPKRRRRARRNAAPGVRAVTVGSYSRRKSRRNPEALLVNPSRPRVRRRASNPATITLIPMGGTHMARKRKSSKRRRARRSNRNPVFFNGRRRSRRSRRRNRNPVFYNPGGIVREVMKGAPSALGGGFALGYINTKIKGGGMVKLLAQVALSIAPTVIKPLGKYVDTKVWMGAVLGSIGAQMGANFAAGKGLLSEESTMFGDDGDMDALIDGDDESVGALIDEESDE